MSPFQPPVSARHSAAPCSTTNPNAMVTMARYGPRTRSAGTASAAPAMAAASPASGSPTQKLQSRRTLRIPVTYAPMA